MSVLARFASATLLAASLGGCYQTINPDGGPAVASLPNAGFFQEDGCVTRDIAVLDPVTGEPRPFHQRFCGGRPVPATDRSAAAPLMPKASVHQPSTQVAAHPSSASARDTQPKKNSPPAKPPAQTPDTPDSPPVRSPQ
jgi:hypothetical protein